jgi:hypothetical protein
LSTHQFTQRGQQLNNNSQNSVIVSADQSKVSNKTKERKSRQESYRGKFSSNPHMIIPQQDFIWAINQHNSVKTLFMECWISDPYGSRWQVLNHSLKTSSFKSAKKILSEAGLFIFKSDRSILDGRQTVCWLVMNLHGARRNDYWLDQKKTQDNPVTSRINPVTSRINTVTSQVNQLTSISDQTQSQQELQNPSETLQEHLSNSSKELLEVLPQVKEVGSVSSGDRFPPLGGAIAPAEQPMEKKEESFTALPTEDEISTQTDELDCPEDSQALNKKSTNDALSQDYKFDWRTTAAADRAASQILAIEAEKTTEEYQSTSKAAFAQIRAKFEQQKKARFAERASRLQGNNPKNDTDYTALAEFKHKCKQKNDRKY